MQGVRRIGRDFDVGARRLETQLGERRVVDGVNDVVRDARMILVTRQHLVEDRAALLLPRVSLVSRVEIADRDELQRVEDGGLVVGGVAVANSGQGLFVILRARGVIDTLPVLIKDREGLDVVAFAAGLGIEREGAVERGCALLQLLRRGRRPDRVIPGARDAPPRHGAGRVGLGSGVVRDPRFLVTEGMEHRRGAGNRLLRSRAA